MKNIKRKHSIWNLYGGVLATIVYGLMAVGFIYIVYLNEAAIISGSKHCVTLFRNLLIFGYTLIERYAIDWCIPITYSILPLFILRFCVFLYHQRYLPLTQNELQANGITNIDDYLTFISDKLMGCTPNRVLDDIALSIYNHLLDESEKQKLYTDNYNLIDSAIKEGRIITAHKYLYGFVDGEYNITSKDVTSIQDLSGCELSTNMKLNDCQYVFIQYLIQDIRREYQIYTSHPIIHHDGVFYDKFKHNHKLLYTLGKIGFVMICINIALIILFHIIPVWYQAIHNQYIQ